METLLDMNFCNCQDDSGDGGPVVEWWWSGGAVVVEQDYGLVLGRRQGKDEDPCTNCRTNETFLSKNISK